MTRRARVVGGGIGAVGVAIATIGLWLLAGLPGVLVGPAVAAALVVVPAPYAVAAGLVLATAVAPADLATGWAVAVQGGLLLLLVVPLARVHAPTAAAVAFGLAVGSLAGVVGLSLAIVDPVWPAAVALAVAATTLAYGLHRVERVRLGAVP